MPSSRSPDTWSSEYARTKPWPSSSVGRAVNARPCLPRTGMMAALMTARSAYLDVQWDVSTLEPLVTGGSSAWTSASAANSPPSAVISVSPELDCAAGDVSVPSSHLESGFLTVKARQGLVVLLPGHGPGAD